MENINHNQGLSSLETETPPPEIINREIMRIKRLREDVLLLRFHLARRTDITEVIDDTDRLLTESALKSSLEVLEGYDDKKIPPAGNISAAASALMYAVDTLVNGARMAEEKDATRKKK